MARKWERMVEKNKKSLNLQRKKHGKSIISAVKAEQSINFHGRSWLLAFIFISFSLFYMVASGFNFTKNSTYNWVIILYLIFGLYLYFIRRPNLKISKTTISSQRFTGPATIKAEDIESITIQTGFIVVSFKHKRNRWVFSKFMHWFDIKGMSIKISKFAIHNNITLKNEVKGD